MLHLIKYSLKSKIKNFNVFFWPLLFPFALITMMYFAIGKIEESDLETIHTAVVSEQTESGQEQTENGQEGTGKADTESIFREYLGAVEESDLIRTYDMDGEKALDALKEKEVDGIFYVGDKVTLTVGANGLPETILESLLQSYREGEQTLMDVAKLHPDGLSAAAEQMERYDAAVEQVSLGGKTTDGTAQFFYAMFGMACLYGCFIGMNCAKGLQANITAKAARRCAAPTHRLKLILSEIVTAFGLHFVNMLLLLAYMKYILKLEFAGGFAQMIPTLFLGSMFGVTFGLFVCSIGKMKESVKIGVMVASSLILSFLAGGMNYTMKDVVEHNFPLLNRVNPVAVISDALYCLNVYDDGMRYAQDLGILAAMCVLMTAGAFLLVRRVRYDSI